MSFQFSPKIITDGLVLYLDAANTRSYPGVGTTWTDLSRGGNTGTLVNGPTFDTGNGGSIVFDGVNDYVQTPLNILGCNNTTQIVWYKWSLINQTGVMTYIGDSGINGVGLYINSGLNNGGTGNKVSVLYGGLFFNALNVGTLFATLTTNWTQLTLTRDTLTTRLYQDGIFLGSTTRVPAGNTSLLNFNIGGGIAAARGNYSQTQIYNRALSATEILQNYNATKTRFGL
jgi:hypothetical protein